MKHLFSLLKNAPSDADKFDFIIARLNPFMLDKLPLSQITDLDHLVKEGLMLESKQCRMESYKEPSAPSNPVEPNSVYKHTKAQTAQLNAVAPAKKQNAKQKGQNQNSGAQASSVTADAGKQPRWQTGGAQSGDAARGAQTPKPAFSRNTQTKFACWNCDKHGHAFRDCRNKQTSLFCWLCGHKGVTSKNCQNPNCKSKNEQRAAAPGGTSQGRPANSATGWAKTGNNSWD
jgi:hypothetical protein